MKVFLTSILLVLVVATDSKAAELAPRINKQEVGVSLSGLAFPATLARDFMSGFENRVVIRFSLLSAGRVFESHDVAVAVKYDLWEELFTVKTRVADVVVNEGTFQRVDQVLRHLDSVQLDGLFPMTSLQLTQEMSLRAELSINPIEREKIERLRKWVTTNSAPGGAGVDPTGAPLTAKPNDVFNAIFDQYIRGEETFSTWKLTVNSKAFTPQLLTETKVK